LSFVFCLGSIVYWLLICFCVLNRVYWFFYLPYCELLCSTVVNDFLFILVLLSIDYWFFYLPYWELLCSTVVNDFFCLLSFVLALGSFVYIVFHELNSPTHSFFSGSSSRTKRKPGSTVRFFWIKNLLNPVVYYWGEGTERMPAVRTYSR